MGYKTIHGIMPVTYPRATTEAESLKLAFVWQSIRYEITTDPMNRFGKASGEVGGNLSILYSLLGSNSAIDVQINLVYRRFR
jgi:muramoyltetrapeptide carboxypeptidase